MRKFTSGVPLSRRDWLKASAAAGALLPALPLLAADRGQVRAYHLCLTPAVVEQDLELLRMIRDAGVSAVWLAGFFYGHQPFPPEQLRRARQRLHEAGLEAHLVNVPLGHPGDSLGAKDGISLSRRRLTGGAACDRTAGPSPALRCTNRRPRRTSRPCAPAANWDFAGVSSTTISASRAVRGDRRLFLRSPSRRVPAVRRIRPGSLGGTVERCPGAAADGPAAGLAGLHLR
ncbi:MAG: twin-arginine translocation signal domain-containing protein [Verrucomicrobia bacterium]|nr:twin-arginine translocation signal domain-containing protein [Verrucomicrobiota bacterium]